MVEKEPILTLAELNGLVRATIERQLDRNYWVEAELMEIREVKGHCYMELVQKAPGNNTPVARASAKCWRQTWAVMAPYFYKVTDQWPSVGMKLLLSVYPQFHETYGFSWIVTAIDPTYTIGDMARKRREIIARLKAEGVFDLNRQLRLPLFAQRIAVISSASAAGYGDFCAQLQENEDHFRFHTQLFTSVMQGEQVAESIIAALDRIHERMDEFDCVVIIRGGGATSDLSGFDSLELAENVANFPLPVITGIGHERDECVLDMISHTRVKTPTAAAAFLIDHLREVALRLRSLQDRIGELTLRRMQVEQMRLKRVSDILPRQFSLVRSTHESRLQRMESRIRQSLQRSVMQRQSRLEQLAQRLPLQLTAIISRNHHRLDMLEQKALSLDPLLPLKRGYSITLVGGKAVRDASQIAPGTLMETRLEQGSVISKVTQSKGKQTTDPS